MASRSAKQTRYAPPTMASSGPKMNPRSSIASSVRSAVASRKPAATSNSLARGIAQQVTTDRNGNRLQRATLGPADPATRRAAIDAALRPGPPVKPQLPVKTAQPVDASGAGGRARSRKIDDLVGKMQ